MPSTVTAEPLESAALGRAARASVPRRSHAAWEAPSDRADPVAVLEAQAEARVPELVPIRRGRMLESPLAFYRGAAAIMAADLAPTPSSGLSAQLCGDAHLENFGAFAAPDRSLVFSVNDFDETLPGPWEWDVKRLAASMAIAGRDRGFNARERRRVALATVREYRAAMRGFAAMGNLDVWYARLDVASILDRWGANADPRQIKTFHRTVAKARAKDRHRALAKLTRRVDGELRIVSEPPVIVPIEDIAVGANGASTAQLEAQINALLRAYRRTLPSDRRQLLDAYRAVHLARKVVGVGSVGTRAWIVLLLGRDDLDPLFLQVKEAERSVLEPYAGRARTRSHGQRVVDGQRRMQSASDIFLGWLRAEGLDDTTRDYYVRQLWDEKGSAVIALMEPKGMALYGEMCGWTLAHAHARTGDRVAIAAYLGSGDVFDRAIAEFAEAYADQNERDHAALAAAVADGSLSAEADV
jgi:uncharacterized protein (DUF2252 family)